MSVANKLTNYSCCINLSNFNNVRAMVYYVWIIHSRWHFSTTLFAYCFIASHVQCFIVFKTIYADTYKQIRREEKQKSELTSWLTGSYSPDVEPVTHIHNDWIHFAFTTMPQCVMCIYLFILYFLYLFITFALFLHWLHNI